MSCVLTGRADGSGRTQQPQCLVTGLPPRVLHLNEHYSSPMAKSRAREMKTRLAARTIGPRTTQRQIISREVPEPLLAGRMCQVNGDLTHPSVRSVLSFFMRSSQGDISVRHSPPDAEPVRPITANRQHPTSDRTHRWQRLVDPHPSRPAVPPRYN